MKKISLCIVAMLFAGASLMANGNVPVKKAKAKQATCTNCTKKCGKANCTKAANCPNMANCKGM